MCIGLVVICRLCFKKRRMRQPTNNYTRINRNYIRHQYPIIQPPPNNISNNTGVYEPISGQSYPRPVSNVASNNATSNNSDLNKNCKRFILHVFKFIFTLPFYCILSINLPR